MVYDLNEEFARRREVLTRGIQAQIDLVDRRMAALREQQAEVGAAQEALAQLEAVLRRMSMLAREAAQKESRRPGLGEEFAACKRTVEELSHRAELYGFNLVRERAEIVGTVLDALMEHLQPRGGDE